MARYIELLRGLGHGLADFTAVVEISPARAAHFLDLMRLADDLYRSFGVTRLQLPRHSAFFVFGGLSWEIINDLEDLGRGEWYSVEHLNDGETYGFSIQEEWHPDTIAFINAPLTELPEPVRLDYISLQVGPEDLFFAIRPRNSDAEMETGYISRAELTDIAAQDETVWTSELVPLLNAWSIIRNNCTASDMLEPGMFVVDPDTGRRSAVVNLECPQHFWDYGMDQIRAVVLPTDPVTLDAGGTQAILETEDSTLTINRV